MSESTLTNDTNNDTTTNAPKPKRARKPKSARTYTVSQMAVIVAERKGIDTSRAGKLVRSKLRANFDAVCKADPSVKRVKSAANDGNRWPAMNNDVRTLIVGK